MDDWGCEERKVLAASYALLAQVLLDAPRRNDPALYRASTWRAFPLAAYLGLAAHEAEMVAMACPVDQSSLLNVAVDYTHLFVGPPQAAAMPWQTMHVNPTATSLSGTPTAEVRRQLHDLGLQRDKGNGQLEDHIGNILMVAAIMAERGLDEKRLLFVREHVLSWIDSLANAVSASASTEFYKAVLSLARAVAQADVDG